MQPDLELLAQVPPLVRVAALGDADAVDRLLATTEPDEADERGWSALHAAAVFNHATVVERLLSAGATVDTRTDDGFTPLLNAANAGPRVLGLLLAAGADPDARADIGWRPIDRLADYGNAAGLRVLLGATRLHVDVRDSDDDPTALMDAAESGSLECVSLLLQAGANPALSSEGDTALDLALAHGHTEIAELLRDAS